MGVLAKGISQKFADFYRAVVYVLYVLHHGTQCATSDQPMTLSIVCLSEFNMLLQGLSRLLAASALQNYLRVC